jgi:hypothetical protein
MIDVGAVGNRDYGCTTANYFVREPARRHRTDILDWLETLYFNASPCDAHLNTSTPQDLKTSAYLFRGRQRLEWLFSN